MNVLQMPVASKASAAAQPGMLSQVWATEGNLARAVVLMQAAATGEATRPERTSAPAPVLTSDTAFYRSYTEGMLRRFGLVQLASARVPALLGRAMFRGRVSSYRMRSFDDVVIFVHDVEQCLALLTPAQQGLLRRVGVQEYTFEEAAAMLRMTLRTTKRRYADALDALTAIFLDRGLLEPVLEMPCQGRKPCRSKVNNRNQGE